MSRRLKDKELPLVRAVFAKAGLPITDSLRIDEMADGGMGSLLFRRGASINKLVEKVGSDPSFPKLSRSNGG